MITREDIRELAQFHADGKQDCALSFYFEPRTPQNKSHKEDYPRQRSGKERDYRGRNAGKERPCTCRSRAHSGPCGESAGKALSS